MSLKSVMIFIFGGVVGYCVAAIWYHHKFYPLIAFFESYMEFMKLKEGLK